VEAPPVEPLPVVVAAVVSEPATVPVAAAVVVEDEDAGGLVISEVAAFAGDGGDVPVTDEPQPAPHPVVEAPAEEVAAAVEPVAAPEAVEVDASAGAVEVATVAVVEPDVPPSDDAAVVSSEEVEVKEAEPSSDVAVAAEGDGGGGDGDVDERHPSTSTGLRYQLSSLSLLEDDNLCSVEDDAASASTVVKAGFLSKQVPQCCSRVLSSGCCCRSPPWCIVRCV
jgi:hypothetical protein